MALSPAAQTLIEQGNRLFSERVGLLTLWQELAEHFYFERANFTVQHSIGEDFAAGSFSSVGALARREMGNAMRSMLRPYDFFEIRSLDNDRNNNSDARSWLQYATKLQREVMYRRGGNFIKATSAGDHDHVTFGQAAVEVAPTPDRSGVFYRNWHLRDVVWSEDYAGSVSDVHRECQPTLSQLVRLFGERVPEALRRDAEKTPHKPVKARHVVVPSDAYDLGFTPRGDHPWASLWLLPEHGTQLEALSRSYRGYVVPRSDTVSGSQYATSPFTSIVLPDSRTRQAIERILLEAGEKAIDPPMIGKLEAVRSDMGLYAGGITWVDAEYDERAGEVLRPVPSDYSGLGFGVSLSDRLNATIRAGLMIDKIMLPDISQAKTAFEVRKIIEQQMRAHIPIFEPVEVEYNEPLCAETFAVMRTLGAFPVAEIPDALRGTDIEYSFKTPIKEAEGDSKRQMLAEGMEVLGTVAKVEQGVVKLMKPMNVARDLLRDVGWPEEWLNDEERLRVELEAFAEQQRASQAGADAAMAAEAAGKAAPMVKALSAAA